MPAGRWWTRSAAAWRRRSRRHRLPPIPGTISRVWGEGPARAQVMTTFATPRARPPAEPRAALERVLERFAEMKLTPVTALEFEFYLIDRERAEGGVPQPPIDPASGNARERPFRLRHRRSRPLS